MPDATILRTTVTPRGDDDLVLLEISDGPLSIEQASMEGSIRLTVETKIRGYKNPALVHIQRFALDQTLEVIRGLR